MLEFIKCDTFYDFEQRQVGCEYLERKSLDFVAGSEWKPNLQANYVINGVGAII